MIYKILLLIFLTLFVGCNTPTEVKIIEKELKVAPITFTGEIDADMSENNPFSYGYPFHDTIRALKIIEHDTIVNIEYLPSENIFKYKFKTDTIKIKYVDTCYITKVEKREPSTFNIILYVMAGFSVGIIFYFIRGRN